MFFAEFCIVILAMILGARFGGVFFGMAGSIGLMLLILMALRVYVWKIRIGDYAAKACICGRFGSGISRLEHISMTMAIKLSVLRNPLSFRMIS